MHRVCEQRTHIVFTRSIRQQNVCVYGLSAYDKCRKLRLSTVERCMVHVRMGNLSAAEKLLPQKKSWREWPSDLLV